MTCTPRNVPFHPSQASRHGSRVGAEKGGGGRGLLHTYLLTAWVLVNDKVRVPAVYPLRLVKARRDNVFMSIPSSAHVPDGLRKRVAALLCYEMLCYALRLCTILYLAHQALLGIQPCSTEQATSHESRRLCSGSSHCCVRQTAMLTKLRAIHQLHTSLITCSTEESMSMELEARVTTTSEVSKAHCIPSIQKCGCMHRPTPLDWCLPSEMLGELDHPRLSSFRHQRLPAKVNIK